MVDTIVKYRWTSGAEYRSEVEWILSVIAHYNKIKWVEDPTAKITIGTEKEASLYVNKEFYDKVLNNVFDPKKVLGRTPHVYSGDNIDPLSTAFYYLNCLWERDSRAVKDKWGRSELTGSVWEYYGYNEPFLIVNEMFDLILRNLDVASVPGNKSVFLSHDIDVVYGAWLQDGKSAILQGRVYGALRESVNHLLGHPGWFNFEEIAMEELKHGFSSTFFWIPVKGPEKGVGMNADYSLNDPKLSKVISELEEHGFSHGIHKSIAPFKLADELKKLDFKVGANRYHYLKFSFEQLIEEMEGSGLKMDASLGYAEVPGYRNGYSLPFVPYHIKERRPSTFVEVPLCIMDGTFSKYLKLDAKEAKARILKMVEALPDRSVVSILWHNSHFTDYKYRGYGRLYSELLSYLHKQEIECATPSQLIYSTLHVD